MDVADDRRAEYHLGELPRGDEGAQCRGVGRACRRNEVLAKRRGGGREAAVMRIALNGVGRIGRAVLRAVAKARPGFDIVALNDLAPASTIAHLLLHDSVHGGWPGPIVAGEHHLDIDGRRLHVSRARDPRLLPWAELGVDLVIDATGSHRAHEPLEGHLEAGAERVIVSAPTAAADATVIFGFNHLEPTAGRILSAGSCTAHSVIPLIAVLERAFGWVGGHLTTVHPATADQSIVDAPHADLRRARSTLGAGIIPTSTSAIDVVRRVMPEIGGSLTGLAYRVPILGPAVSDLVAQVERPATVDEVHEAFRQAAARLPGDLLACSDQPLVGIDFRGRTQSATLDTTLTDASPSGRIHIAAWYDNEVGYAHRLVDLANHLASKSMEAARLAANHAPAAAAADGSVAGSAATGGRVARRSARDTAVIGGSGSGGSVGGRPAIDAPLAGGGPPRGLR